jgi:hypothetical protein
MITNTEYITPLLVVFGVGVSVVLLESFLVSLFSTVDPPPHAIHFLVLAFQL